MRIGALLRRQGMDRLDAWYAAVGRALHVDGRQPHRREVATDLLAAMGLDPGLVDAAIADPTTGDEVMAEHQRVTRAGGFGVPTLFFPDGQCLFGPVLIGPPAGDAAERLWDAVVAWTAFPHLHEIQRPKGRRTRSRSGWHSSRTWRRGTGSASNRSTVVGVAAPTRAAAEGSMP